MKPRDLPRIFSMARTAGGLDDPFLVLFFSGLSQLAYDDDSGGSSMISVGSRAGGSMLSSSPVVVDRGASAALM